MNTKPFLLCFGLLLCACSLFSQHKVHFIIQKLPAYHQANDRIYLVGNFNNWNPSDQKLQLQNNSGKYGITIELPKGMYEYKFTRGSWQKVESGSNGVSTDNRRLLLESDTIINADIEQWSDHFPPPAKRSTSSKNVHVIDTAFYIPQLNRYRRIWIYLPDAYCTTKNKYPVLYMHDGQNVFDEATSGFGEWGVDEALDTLEAQTKECIVVAIDNGAEKRLNEYSPFDMEKYGKGEGDAYVDFLAKTLKPFIDKHYRTKKDVTNTFIAGSSMGGLISMYAILKYPNVYGGAGVFSPAFWIAPKLLNYIYEKGKGIKGKIYFYAGKHESESMIPDMLSAFEKLHKVSSAQIEVIIRDEGKHNEPTWRKEFPLFYHWLMQD
ncbi:MAG: alpha-dextran endo-1,6-alpha-glucosidase [Chitinophagaceae bacterium]